jgi:hypothetical protein
MCEAPTRHELGLARLLGTGFVRAQPDAIAECGSYAVPYAVPYSIAHSEPHTLGYSRPDAISNSHPFTEVRTPDY